MATDEQQRRRWVRQVLAGVAVVLAVQLVGIVCTRGVLEAVLLVGPWLVVPIALAATVPLSGDAPASRRDGRLSLGVTATVAPTVPVWVPSAWLGWHIDTVLGGIAFAAGILGSLLVCAAAVVIFWARVRRTRPTPLRAVTVCPIER